MKDYSAELVKSIRIYEKKYGFPKKGSYFDLNKYVGSSHPCSGLSNPLKEQIAKEFKKGNPNLTLTELVTTLDSLFSGKTYEEKTLASTLLNVYPKLRKELNPRKLDEWLDHLEGWAEIDSLCQSSFTAEEVLENWDTWKTLLTEFNQSKNISKRRASLVLLNKPLRESDDERLAKIALKNVDNLKSEKEVIITKAISWVLREMSKNHHNLVKEYLDENEATLPKIAVRETRKKLTTGKKTG